MKQALTIALCLLALSSCIKQSSITDKKSRTSVAQNGQNVKALTASCPQISKDNSGFIKITGDDNTQYGALVVPGNHYIETPPMVHNLVENSDGTYSDYIGLGTSSGYKATICATGNGCTICKTFSSTDPTSPTTPTFYLPGNTFKIIAANNSLNGPFSFSYLQNNGIMLYIPGELPSGSASSCPIPNVQGQIDATDTTVDIRVLYPPNTSGPFTTLINIKKDGETNWTQKCLITDNYLLRIYGLETGTTYNVSLAFMCSANSTSDFSQIFNISTITW